MIYLSAGHNPSAPGAAWKGFVEHAEATLWVSSIRDWYPQCVVVPSLSLNSKIAWVNKRASPLDLLVEVHFNAAAPGARGCETLYAPGSKHGARVAESLQGVLERFFRGRGVKEGWYQQDPRRGPLALLARTKCISVIIEPEFVYNAELIRSQRKACCAALASELRRLA